MSRPPLTIFLAAGLLAAGPLAGAASGCPFCSAVTQTFSEEIASMDAVVIARLVQGPPAKAPQTPTGDVPKAKFQVLEALKGEALLTGRREIETVYFGEVALGDTFLMMGVDPPDLSWSSPLPLSERGRAYLKQVVKLPPEGPDRLVFFQEYLEDPEETLSQDAYDEFARTPYGAVKELKPRMKHDQLVAWIKDADVPASRRRLYLTMLGVCGGQGDLALLEEMLKSDDRKAKAGLDALIACYLTLKGPAGMPLIEQLFLRNQEAEYADTYAAIMALRFHGTEADIVPRQRILQGLHYMLERPQLADLIIPDLARWEDWSQLDRLVRLFKEADENSSWVRVPVVNYVRACPLPAARERLQELEKIDPAAVQRANTFFPFGPGAAAPSPDKPSAPPGGDDNPP